MKSWFLSFLICLLALHRFISAEALYAPCSLPDQVNYFVNCFADEQLKSNQLTLVTKNGEWGECCKLEKIALMFDYFDTLDLMTARKMILGITTRFLQEINKQDKLKCFFENFPLSLDNISIQIRMRNEHCGFVYPVLGNIASISIDSGFITYGTMNSYTYKIDTLRRESYDQAVQLSTPR